MYTEKQIREILDNWDIEKGLSIKDIYKMDGYKVSGNVWSIGDKYILKTANLEKLVKNIRIAKALHEQGFSASLPVPTKKGAEYLEGDNPFILTYGLQGNPLPRAERFGPNCLEHGFQYGRSIAKLHMALNSIQKDMSADEVNLYQDVTVRALPNVKRQNQQWNMGIDEDIFNDFIETFGELHFKLPKQLIHKDPNPSNILFDNGKVSGFIDFDLSEVNIRLWDVCCATGILSEGSDEAYEKWLDILLSILKGYDSEEKMTVEEKHAVFYVIFAIQVICVAYFEGIDKYKELAKTNRQILKYIVGNKLEIQNMF